MSDHYDGNSEPLNQPQPEQEAPDSYGALQDLGYSPDEAAHVREALGGIIDHGIEQAVQPLQEQLGHVNSQLAEQQLEEEYADLEEKYPALLSEGVADDLILKAQEFCAERGMNPQAAGTPDVLELVFLREQSRYQGRPQPGSGQPQVNDRGAVDFGAETAESRTWNDEILGRAGPKDFWGYNR